VTPKITQPYNSEVGETSMIVRSEINCSDTLTLQTTGCATSSSPRTNRCSPGRGNLIVCADPRLFQNERDRTVGKAGW